MRPEITVKRWGVGEGAGVEVPAGEVGVSGAWVAADGEHAARVRVGRTGRARVMATPARMPEIITPFAYRRGLRAGARRAAASA